MNNIPNSAFEEVGSASRQLPGNPSVANGPRAYKQSSVLRWKAASLTEVACSFRLVPRRPRPLSLGVVLAAWDTIATARSIELLQSQLRKLKGVTWSMVVVANSDAVLAATTGQGGPDVTVIAGSNEEAEFSAYEEGRQAVARQAGPAPDVWLIVNDRLPAYALRQLRSINKDLLYLTSKLQMAPGHIYPLVRPITVWQHRFSCFMSSYWLLLPARALDGLGSLTSVTMEEYARHVPADFPGYWPLSEWLGPELGDFIGAYLTEPGLWSRSEPLNAASWPRLRFKALSIINEHLLSARLVELGLALMPWHQARAMSQLDPTTAFSQSLVQIYRDRPELGPGIEMTPHARACLAGAIMAARAKLAAPRDRLLTLATRSGDIALNDWRSRKTASLARF